MKYLKRFLMILIASTLFARGTVAFDFTDNMPAIPGPVGQLNLTGIISELSTMKSYVDQVSTHRDTLKSMTDLSKITQMAKQYAMKLGKSALNKLLKKKKKQKNITYARTIEQCKKARVFDNTENDLVLVDVDKEELVAKAYEKMFLQYSSRKAMSKYVYEQKGEQLKMDTTLEMFIIAKEMQKELNGEEVKLFGAPLKIPEGENAESESKKLEQTLKDNVKDINELGLGTQLKLYERCLVAGWFCDFIKVTSCNDEKDAGGEKGEEGQKNDNNDTNEDRLCFVNSAIKVALLYDQIMRYNESLVAMMMQYRAVKAISNVAKIQEYEAELTDEEILESELEDNYKDNVVTVASNRTTADAMFAAMTTEDTALIEIRRWGITRDSTDNTLHGEFEFNDGNETFKDHITDKEEDFWDMKSIGAAEDDLQEAIKLHHVLQILPDYLEVYKSYNHAIDMHKLSRKKVLTSGNCVKRFLEPYYGSINEAWYGKRNCTEDDDNPGQVICHYTDGKSIDSTEPSKGLYDVPCPDNKAQKCFAMGIDDYLETFGEESIAATDQPQVAEMPDDDTIFEGGILQYLVEFYRAAIDGNAVYDYDKEDPVLVVVDETQQNVYAPQVEIKTEKVREDNPSKNPLAKHFDPVPEADFDINSETPAEDEPQEEEENPDEGSSNVFATERDEVSDATEVKGSMKNRNQDSGDPSDPSVQPQVKNQDEKDAQDEDAKVQSMLRWTIGAAVIKDIADDLRLQENRKFGKPGGHNFPMWNDYMEFYTGYLTGKYRNMISYIKTVPTGVLLVRAAATNGIQLPQAETTGDDNSNSETQTEEETAADDEEEIIKAMIGTVEAGFYKIEEDYNRDVKKLKENLDLLVRARDKAAEDLSEANARYNKAVSEINRAKLAMDAGESARDYNDSLYADREGADVGQMPQHKDAERMKKEGDELRAKAEAERDAAQLEADELERKIKELEEKIEEVEEKIEDRKHRYVMEMTDYDDRARDMEKGTAEAILSARANDHSATKILEKLFEDQPDLSDITCIEPTEEEKCKGTDVACKELFKCARKYAINEIWEKALKSTKGDKSDLIKLIEDRMIYSADEGEHIRQSIHKPLIDKITHISVADMATVCNPTEYAPLVALGITEVDLLGDICKDDFCTTPETDDAGGDVYLLGPKGVGLPHDFVAPSNAPIFSSAPLREIFYFDEDDFTHFSKWYNSVWQNGRCHSDDCVTENADIYLSQRLLYNEMIRDADDPDNDSVFMHSPSMNNILTGEEDEHDTTVPEIWRLLLRPWTHVLSNIDLQTFLGNIDNPPKTQKWKNGRCKVSDADMTLGCQHDLGRIGMYPCLYVSKEAPVDENLYVIDAHDQRYAYKGSRPEYDYQLDEHGNKKRDKDGKYIRKLQESGGDNRLWIDELVHYIDQNKLDPSPYDPDVTLPEEVLKLLPPCKALEIHGIENKDVLIYDKEVDYELDDPRNPYDDSMGTVSSQSSELGRIFTFRELYTPGKPRLTFNQYLVNAIRYHYEEYGEEGHENETSRENYGRRIFLRTNQLGDFLDQVEGMKVTAEGCKKTEKNMLETRKNIAEIVLETGFVLSPEFDLTNQSDYDNLRRNLIETKEKYLASALAKLSEVQGKTEMMQERAKNLTREIKLYQMDSENAVEGYPGDLVTISGDETDAEMMDKIKEANSNYAINQEIIKEQDAERERELNQFWLPYCAVYPIE